QSQSRLESFWRGDASIDLKLLVESQLQLNKLLGSPRQARAAKIRAFFRKVEHVLPVLDNFESGFNEGYGAAETERLASQWIANVPGSPPDDVFVQFTKRCPNWMGLVHPEENKWSDARWKQVIAG